MPETTRKELPQHETRIDGAQVHFLHIRSSAPDALPLILTHGWPGSIVEFLGVIDRLSEDHHLVIPAIPGFGFSGPPARRARTSTVSPAPGS
ncbi:pimeloyl-ACP methyl ester carboxylesterase [Streptomyces canus]|nr:pimeloyl-ACP methyl ester carboxylesterase [Streptomyces canus]